MRRREGWKREGSKMSESSNILHYCVPKISFRCVAKVNNNASRDNTPFFELRDSL